MVLVSTTCHNGTLNEGFSGSSGKPGFDSSMDACCYRQPSYCTFDPFATAKHFDSVTAARMSFEIAPMKEDEIDIYIKTSWEALTSTEDSLLSLVYPDGFTESVQSNMRKTTRDGLSDPSTSYILIRNSDTKSVVAVACWYYQMKDLTIQAAKLMSTRKAALVSSVTIEGACARRCSPHV
jgi:hypothetical protein